MWMFNKYKITHSLTVGVKRGFPRFPDSLFFPPPTHRKKMKKLDKLTSSNDTSSILHCFIFPPLGHSLINFWTFPIGSLLNIKPRIKPCLFLSINCKRYSILDNKQNFITEIEIISTFWITHKPDNPVMKELV